MTYSINKFAILFFQLTPDDNDIKTNWEKDMKNGQDYMRKASSICFAKPPESESTEDSVPLKVCCLIFINNIFAIKSH